MVAEFYNLTAEKLGYGLMDSYAMTCNAGNEEMNVPPE